MHVVNWIDSKAMFGDPTTFETEHLPQLMGYVNRYGPGMVIYWFGFVDSLFQLTPTEPDVIVVGSLPETFHVSGNSRGLG